MSSPPSQQRGARRAIASFGSYAEAQEAVDFLSDRKFPVERLSIVGEDLRYVEQVTGRLNFGRAALQGLLAGAVFGAALGLIFGLFTFLDPLTSALVLAFWGLILGAVLGLLLGLAGHALSGGRRDFSSVSAMQASRYDVLADDDVAEDAGRILAQRA